MILYNVKDCKLSFKPLNERNGTQSVGFFFTSGKVGDGQFSIIDINKKLPIGTPYLYCAMGLNESLVWEILLQIELDGLWN